MLWTYGFMALLNNFKWNLKKNISSIIIILSYIKAKSSLLQ